MAMFETKKTLIVVYKDELLIRCALDSDCPLVVGAAGRTPGAVLLLYAEGDLPILSDAIITACLSSCACKASADALRR